MCLLSCKASRLVSFMNFLRKHTEAQRGKQTARGCTAHKDDSLYLERGRKEKGSEREEGGLGGWGWFGESKLAEMDFPVYIGPPLGSPAFSHLIRECVG